MLTVKLNRIDGTVGLPSVRPENVSIHGDEAAIRLLLSGYHEIDLYFPAPGGALDVELLEVARDVLTQLARMDNDVQRLCAEQSVRSSYDSSNYEGELAQINIEGSDLVVLHYFGTKVNTEWDENFVRADGQWMINTQ